MLIFKLSSTAGTKLPSLLGRTTPRFFAPVMSFQTSAPLAADTVAATAKTTGPIGHHAKMFKIERYFALASLPLIPLSYFVHGHAMDYVLIAAIVINGHWGGTAVVQDYARAIVVGERFAAIAPKLMYVGSAILLVVLLHFEFNDVGLTRAFEMVFSL